MIYCEKVRLFVDIVTLEFKLNGLPDDAVHISGFRGEDRRIQFHNSSILAAKKISLPQLFHPRHKIQIYGPLCQGGH
jgi:hypothetical protein